MITRLRWNVILSALLLSTVVASEETPPGLVNKDSEQDLVAEASNSNGQQAQKREAGLSNSYGEPLPPDAYGPPKDLIIHVSDISPAPVYGVPEQQNFQTPPGAYGPPAPINFNNQYDGPPPPVLPHKEYGLPKQNFKPRPEYGPPKQEYGPPKQEYGPPKQEYGLPKLEYGPPKQEFGPPKPEYGPPKQEYGPPKQTYGPPKPVYGPPKKHQQSLPKQNFGQLFNKNKVIYAKPLHNPKPVYGPPKGLSVKPVYGPPKQEYGPPKQEYGPPKQEYGPPKQEYGPPKQEYGPPKQEYGPPKPEYGPPKTTYGVPVGPLHQTLPAPIYGTPFPNINLNLKPNFPLPSNSYGPPGNSLGPIGPDNILIDVDNHIGNYGPPQPDPNPRPPHPGIPAPPTPPHVQFDGWKPIPGVSLPINQGKHQVLEIHSQDFGNHGNQGHFESHNHGQNQQVQNGHGQIQQGHSESHNHGQNQQVQFEIQQSVGLNEQVQFEVQNGHGHIQQGHSESHNHGQNQQGLYESHNHGQNQQVQFEIQHSVGQNQQEQIEVQNGHGQNQQGHLESHNHGQNQQGLYESHNHGQNQQVQFEVHHSVGQNQQEQIEVQNGHSQNQQGHLESHNHGQNQQVLFEVHNHGQNQQGHHESSNHAQNQQVIFEVQNHGQNQQGHFDSHNHGQNQGQFESLNQHGQVQQHQNHQKYNQEFLGQSLPSLNQPHFSSVQNTGGYSSVHQDILSSIDLKAIVGGDSNKIDQSKTVFEAHYTEPAQPIFNQVPIVVAPLPSYGTPDLNIRQQGSKGLVPPSGVYGVPPGGQYGIPPRPLPPHIPIPFGHPVLPAPRQPIRFRDHPPREIKDVNQHIGNQVSFSIEPSNLYSLPHSGNPVKFLSLQMPSNLYGSPIDSYSAPLNTVADHSTSGSSLNSVITNLDGKILSNLSSFDAAAILKHCPYHEAILRAAQNGEKIPSDLASSYVASLSSLGSQLSKTNDYNNDLATAAQTVVENVVTSNDIKNDKNEKQSVLKGKSLNEGKSSAYKEQDVSEQITKTSEKIKNLREETKLLQEKIATTSQNIKQISSQINYSDIIIPKGNQGSYSIQIQSSENGNKYNRPEIPHEQLLSEGLLQSILHAIEQPNNPKSQQQPIPQPQSEGLELPAGYEPIDRSKVVFANTPAPALETKNCDNNTKVEEKIEDDVAIMFDKEKSEPVTEISVATSISEYNEEYDVNKEFGEKLVKKNQN